MFIGCSHRGAHNDPKLLILLPPPQSGPPSQVYVMLELKPRALCNKATTELCFQNLTYCWPPPPLSPLPI